MRYQLFYQTRYTQSFLSFRIKITMPYTGFSSYSTKCQKQLTKFKMTFLGLEKGAKARSLKETDEIG